jgi:hypothetical protein
VDVTDTPQTPEEAGTEPIVVAAAQAAETAAVAASAVPAVEVPHAVPNVPVYATRMPPSARLGYLLKRGWLSGRGELQWSVLPDQRYEARLEGSVAGWTVLDWTSRGLLDRAGVAPERFVIRRKGREQLAANFQRAAGKITYSGPTIEFVLVPGAQDRLSWMLQLAAIAEADPSRMLQPGRKIELFISGARGDADVWTFDTLGEEYVTTPAGTARALRLRREPRQPRDTRVEIWLDPARHHLPVRALLANPGDDDPLELQLSEIDAAP